MIRCELDVSSKPGGGAKGRGAGSGASVLVHMACAQLNPEVAIEMVAGEGTGSSRYAFYQADPNP